MSPLKNCIIVLGGIDMNSKYLIIKKGDLLKATESCIVHQGNNLGVMGAGVAKVIRRKYPQHYRDYIHYFDIPKRNEERMGDVILTSSVPYDIACVIGQMSIGKWAKTSVESLERGIRMLCQKYDSLAFPYLIGCGLGNGDVNIVLPMLERVSDETKTKFVLYKL